MAKRIIPIRYSVRDSATHFEELIEEVENSIFIYNENVRQWQNKEDYGVGGGNAIIRPYRLDGLKNQDKNVGSWGIPTGHRYKGPEYYCDIKNRKKLANYIDTGFNELIDYLKLRPEITTIYYSCDKTSDNIGIEIFAYMLGNAKEMVKERFRNGFQRLETELGFIKESMDKDN